MLHKSYQDLQNKGNGKDLSRLLRLVTPMVTGKCVVESNPLNPSLEQESSSKYIFDFVDSGSDLALVSFESSCIQTKAIF